MSKHYNIDGFNPSVELGKGNSLIKDATEILEARTTGDLSYATVRVGSPIDADSLATQVWSENSVSSDHIQPSLGTDLSWSGMIRTRNVLSNSVGFGALLYSNEDGDLIEADPTVVLTGAGVYIALEAGTGNVRVLYWNGWVRNDSWSFTPGATLYASPISPGEISEAPSFGDETFPIGFAETASIVYFGPLSIYANPIAIQITHTGQTFEPMVEVDVGAEVLWSFPDGTTSQSVTPSKDFGTAETRQTSLYVNPFSALRLLNFGYVDAFDGSNLGPEYEIDQQNVTAVEGITYATGLNVFCAMNNDALASLDFNGLLELTTVETYGSDGLLSIDLTGCTAITRLGIESCGLLSLDLSDCLLLEDLRGSLNAFNEIVFGSVPFDYLWHACIRNNAYTVNVDLTLFPVLIDCYLWTSQQTGAAVFTSEVLSSVLMYNNDFTSVDMSSCTRVGYGTINLNNNPNLVSVNFDNWTGVLNVHLNGCALPQAMVDYVLTTLDGFGSSNGIVDVSAGTSSAPSATGEAAVASLEGKGWTVTTNASSAPTILSTSPDDNETGIAVDASLEMIFSEAVTAQAGGTIEIRLTSDDSLFESFDVTTDITGDGTDTIGFTPTSNFSLGEDYYVLISAGAFENAASDPFAGISDTTAWNFATVGSAVTIVSTTPDDDETGVAIDSSLEIIFSEVVNAQAGGTIEIRLTSDDSLFESFDVTTDITGDGTTTIGVTPSSSFTNSEGYYVLISSGAFQSGYGIDFGGISSTTEWNFTAVGVYLWQDTFDDYSTTDPAENGWVAGTSCVHQIDNNMYYRTDSGEYRRSYNLCGSTLPADRKLTVIIPHATAITDYWGITNRILASGVGGSGVALFYYSGSFHIVDADDPWTTLESWTYTFTVDQPHTIEWVANGDQHTITIDGTDVYGPYTNSINETDVGSGVGTCGDAQGGKYWDTFTIENV